jgi:Transcriptional regulators
MSRATRRPNHAFHLFLIEASGNAPLITLYKQLAVQDYIGRALRDDIEIVGDIVQQHRDLVSAFEYGDINAAREVIAQHALHSKATMSRALGKKSAPTAIAPAPQPEPARCPFAALAEQQPYSHELSWPQELQPFKVVDDGSQGDPYEHYRWMREHAPVLRCQSATSDVWFLSRYDDVWQAIRNPKLFSSEVVSPPPLTFLTLYDAPDHTRLRKIAQPSFSRWPSNRLPPRSSAARRY